MKQKIKRIVNLEKRSSGCSNEEAMGTPKPSSADIIAEQTLDELGNILHLVEAIDEKVSGRVPSCGTETKEESGHLLYTMESCLKRAKMIQEGLVRVAKDLWYSEETIGDES